MREHRAEIDKEHKESRERNKEMQIEVVSGAQAYQYMLESTTHMLNKNTISNDAIYVKVDFLYCYLACISSIVGAASANKNIENAINGIL